MKKDKEKFLKGCLKKGYKTAMIEKVWNFMEKFAAYGFNKPHSASYGLIAYWTAYIKANYPVEYMTALLTAELHGVAGPQREIKMSQAIEECRRMEIKVLPPDINKSIYSFSIEGSEIRFGLSALKNVGTAAIDSILEERAKGNFHGLKDFLSRVDLRRVNKRTVESLVKSGAFSNFANKATLMFNYPLVVADIQRSKIKEEKGQYDLFVAPGEKKLTDNFKVIPEYEEDVLFTMEREVIGFLIGKNPMAKYKAIIEKKTTKKIGEVTIQDANKPIILAGLISGKKIVKTKKNNEEMAIIQIFDESGTIEVVVFPRSYTLLKSFLNINKIIMLKGKVNEREGRIGIILENAVDLEKINH
jgi:DNA polymerase-3 subunit alpha